MHVIEQASQSLQYAHDHQVMHLDVKPANFLIQTRSASDDFPDLLLSDFGIARLATMTSDLSQHVRGTPTYMSPEQCNGQPTFASDQYALAIMAYELLTSRPPFVGNPMSVMFSHVHEQPSSVCQQNPLVPTTVDPVLQRALAKKPDERFPSITAFAHAFTHAFQCLADVTTLRVLRPSPATPPPQMPDAPAAGDVRATLTLSAEEARRGTTRRLTLANGQAVSVQIPAGAQSGQVLILIGQGEKPNPNIPAGNLYLTLSVGEASPQILPNSEMVPTALSSLPVQASSPTPGMASVQEEKRTPPPLILSGSAQSSSHVSHAHSVSAFTQATLPLRDAITPPPPLVQPKRRHFSPSRIVLIMFVLMLLGGASFGIYSAIARQPSPTTPQQFSTTISPNGRIWTPQTSSISYTLNAIINAIVWSGSQFIAVTYLGAILTSPDGHIWTPQTSGTSHVLHAIAWSGSQFVTVGDQGTILISPNGRTWTPQTSDTSHVFEGIVWSGSQFVIVGETGTILTSP